METMAYTPPIHFWNSMITSQCHNKNDYYKIIVIRYLFCTESPWSSTNLKYTDFSNEHQLHLIILKNEAKIKSKLSFHISTDTIS